MPLRLPHSVTVQEATPTVNGAGEITGYSYSPITTVACQITPASSKEVFESFGIELDDARILICAVADESNFTTLNSKVTFSTVEFRVKARPMTYAGIGACDHTLVLLERVI